MNKEITICRIKPVKGQIHHRGDTLLVSVVQSLTNENWYQGIGLGFLEVEFSNEIFHVYNPMRLVNFDINSVIWQLSQYKRERALRIQKQDSHYDKVLKSIQNQRRGK